MDAIHVDMLLFIACKAPPTVHLSELGVCASATGTIAVASRVPARGRGNQLFSVWFWAFKVKTKADLKNLLVSEYDGSLASVNLHEQNIESLAISKGWTEERCVLNRFL